MSMFVHVDMSKGSIHVLESKNKISYCIPDFKYQLIWYVHNNTYSCK